MFCLALPGRVRVTHQNKLCCSPNAFVVSSTLSETLIDRRDAQDNGCQQRPTMELGDHEECSLIEDTTSCRFAEAECRCRCRAAQKITDATKEPWWPQHGTGPLNEARCTASCQCQHDASLGYSVRATCTAFNLNMQKRSRFVFVGATLLLTTRDLLPPRFKYALRSGCQHSSTTCTSTASVGF